MKFEHFGYLLKELRQSRNLTREQLAHNICNPKQIYRIEKGEYEPSLYLLNQLSIKFNMDLNEYFKMHFTSQSIIGFEGIKNINHAIEHNRLDSLKLTIEKYEKLNEFKQGENLQHILYGKSLCAALLDKDYNLSLNYCMKGIQVENSEFTIDTIAKCTYSNVGLSMINCISMNYMALNQQKIGIKVLIDLLEVLDSYVINAPYPMYQATEFSKKIYQNTLCNLSIFTMKNGEFNKAMVYADSGINFSLKEYNFRFLPDLLLIKFELLYNLKNFEEAKDYYSRVIHIYKIMNQNNKLVKLEESAPDKYPEIFHIS